MTQRIGVLTACVYLLGSTTTAWAAEAKRPDNTPPPGFKALFNGKDLTGWKGLVANPKVRAKMSAEKLAAEQKKADQQMRDHWKVIDGVLEYDGKGNSLCTAKDYADFELYVDWKIKEKGDSGIYLRGSPQVQIWDPMHWKIGSGGLYNNKKGPSQPLPGPKQAIVRDGKVIVEELLADNPIGEWNTFHIKMVGEKVWVKLNGRTVVNGVVMENYWERDKPIYPTGQIELQHHGNTIWFKNVYIKELPRKGE